MVANKVKHEVKNPFSDYKAQIGRPFPEIMKELGLEKTTFRDIRNIQNIF